MAFYVTDSIPSVLPGLRSRQKGRACTTMERLHWSNIGGGRTTGLISPDIYFLQSTHDWYVQSMGVLCHNGLVLTVEQVDSTIQGSGAGGWTSAEWASLLPYLPQNAVSRLSSMSAKFADLQVVAGAVLEAPPKTATEHCIMQVLKSAVEIDAVLAQWPESIPAGWDWLPAFGFDCPSETPRAFFVYQDRADIYYDLWVAGIWNKYRSTRTMIQSIVLDCISRVTLVDSKLMQQSWNAIRISQQMVDDLCGSIPYHMGTKIDGGPGNDAGIKYPFHVAGATSKEQHRASATLGGWHLIEPLRIALKVTCLRDGQKEWITQQLIRIGNIYSVNLLSKPRSSH